MEGKSEWPCRAASCSVAMNSTSAAERHCACEEKSACSEQHSLGSALAVRG